MSCGCNPLNPSYTGLPVPPALPAFGPPTGINGAPDSTSSGSTVTTCPDYLSTPVISEVLTSPAPGSQGQLKTLCAYKWVVAGAALSILPFGTVLVTGVAGDVVSFQNTNIPGGTTIIPGTYIIQGPPQAAISDIQGTALDSVRGFYDGIQKFMPGSANTLMRFCQIGTRVAVQPVSGMIFFPNATPSTEIAAKDIGGAAVNTTPFDTAPAGATCYYDLPNLPASNLLPASFIVLVHIRLAATTVLSGGNELVAKSSSIEVLSGANTSTTHGDLHLSVTGTKLQIDYVKAAATSGTSARLRVLGYFF